VMKWQYDTICRGGNSLIERLAARFPDVNLSEYISFYSLRRAGMLNGTMVTSQLYIHSKLIIVDDRRVIIGSANYNDRSMNGDRDSEICVVVEDNQFVESRMNGQFFLAAKFAHSLRVNLFQEHLGLTSPELLLDPIHPNTYQTLWRATAMTNTQIFASIFPGTPRDCFHTIAVRFIYFCIILLQRFVILRLRVDLLAICCCC
jgi:phospholipase D1/2